MRNHQPIKAGRPLLVAERQTGLDEKRRAVHMQRVVDGNRASGRKWHALASDGLAVIGQAGDPEKHKRSILAAHFLGALRIGAPPITDAIQRHFPSRDDVALDENTADRNVWVSVMGVVGDAQYCSVF